MTNIVAPPPLILNQLSDLIAFVQNVEAVAKLVKDLKAASKEYEAALQAVALANSESYEKLSKLEKLEVSIDGKQAKLDKAKAEHEAKAQHLAESEAGLQSAYANFESRVQEFEAYAKGKETELANAEAKVVHDASVVAEAEAKVQGILAELESKKAAVMQALGA